MSIHDHFKSVSTGASNSNKSEKPLILYSEVNPLRWSIFPVKMTKRMKFTTIQPLFCKRSHCTGMDRVPDEGRDGVAA